MKRRRLLRYASAAAIASLGSGLAGNWRSVNAQTSGISIQWLGHTCFYITGSGQRVLTNPFMPIGCTSGYQEPKATADLVMISSRMLDEGVVVGLPGNPRILAESGIFQLQGMQIQGVPVAHDREGGNRFGENIIWRWQQGGLNLVHLGGAAGSIEFEQRVLLGRPDVLFVPVGGSVKAYNAQEAKAVVESLNPRLVVPTHYRTQAADERCAGDYALSPVDEFLTLMSDTPTQQLGSDSYTINSSNLGDNPRIVVFQYPF